MSWQLAQRATLNRLLVPVVDELDLELVFRGVANYTRSVPLIVLAEQSRAQSALLYWLLELLGRISIKAFHCIVDVLTLTLRVCLAQVESCGVPHVGHFDPHSLKWLKQAS